MRVPSPDGQRPCGRLPTGMVATCEKSSVRNTLTSLVPPIVTLANVPFGVRAKLTWLVIGPVSMVLIGLNGGLALNTRVLPMPLSVNHTCSPSGVTAMFGQNGLSCFTRATMAWSATDTTTVSGLKDEQT